MQNDGEARNSLLDLMKNIKAELGLCAGFKLICAMAGSDGDCQRVNASLGYKLLNLIRLGVGRIFRRYVYVILTTTP